MGTRTASVADHNTVGWRFDNTYARLPDALFAPATPARVREPRVSILNHRLADELGLDLGAMSPEAAAALFAGQDLPAGSRPIAQAYAGHQFGDFTMLGDGRAILLGEHRTPAGRLVDIQFKGAGRTRFSRGGDGLAALGPMLREYVISEAMAALGIPTTRSLAVVTTGEPVYRDVGPAGGDPDPRGRQPHPGRDVRVRWRPAGTSRPCGRWPTTRSTATTRNWPTPRGSTWSSSARSRTARPSLIARWQLVGFIHGVMNTDNMAISGETIDYGPCAFMNAYDPDTVFSSIDHGGRYAYGNQPAIAQWNLARFAETLLPLLDPDPEKAVAVATEVLGRVPRPVRAVLARRDAEEAGAPDGRGRRRRVDPVAARLDAEVPGRLHQHVPRPVVGGAAGRRPVPGPGLPGLVRPVAGAARP